MKHWKIRMVLFTLVLALAFLQPVKVSAYVLPKDLPTIEH